MMALHGTVCLKAVRVRSSMLKGVTQLQPVRCGVSMVVAWWYRQGVYTPSQCTSHACPLLTRQHVGRV